MIVFLASMLIPLLKLLGLFYLVLTTRLRSSVTDIELSSDATAAHVRLLISPRYARLVRIGSRFWTVSGLDVNVSLLKGVEISVESLRSLIAGGIAFATPDDPTTRPARDGTVFVLHDKPQKQWLTWAPKIPPPPPN